MSEVPPFQLMAANAGDFLENLCALNVNSHPHYAKLTKICATIGPASTDPRILEKLFEKGMDVARLSLVTETWQFHTQTVKNLRIAAANYSKKIGRPYHLAIGISTRGPTILTGLLEGGPKTEVVLKKGEIVKLTIDKAYEERGTAQVIYIDYANITKMVKIGYRIYIDDGLIALVCTNIQGTLITCYIEHGGKLGSHKGVNLPAVNVDLPSVSEQDLVDFKFAIDNKIDIIFAPFIRDAKGLQDIRDVLGEEGKNIMLFAKIENHQGLRNLDDIIQTSDGIMIARLDLGIEIPTEKLFLAQKTITARCNKYGKPVICAAQMLFSMVKQKNPTKAECSDVANAVLDGVDCVTLSAESSNGDYPVRAVQVMANICREADAALWQKKYYEDLVNQVKPPIDTAHCIAITAVKAAIQCSATAIIVTTTTGRSARLVSRYRPPCPIIAISRDSQVVRHSLVFRALFPIYYKEERLPDWGKDIEARINFGIDYGKAEGIIRSGDPVIIINGWKKGSGFTNTLRVVYVSDYVTPVTI